MKTSTSFAPIPGTQVIAVCGQARHGKDSLALAFLRAWPGAERFAFSDGIAAMLRANGDMGPARSTPLMQEAGLALRQERPAAWLDVIYGAICDRRPPLAVVTGVRFQDEADMIHAMGGKLVRVRRLTAHGFDYESDDRPASHPTETAIRLLDADETLTIGPGEFDTLTLYAQSVTAILRCAA